MTKHPRNRAERLMLKEKDKGRAKRLPAENQHVVEEFSVLPNRIRHED